VRNVCLYFAADASALFCFRLDHNRIKANFYPPDRSTPNTFGLFGNSLPAAGARVLWAAVKWFLIFLLLSVLMALGARGQDMVVYDDALESGWVSYGWAALNFSNASPVHAGKNSVSVADHGTKSGALYLHHEAFAPSLYESLSFWIYPIVGRTNEVAVRAMLNGKAQPPVRLSFTAAQVNHWQLERIPLSSLGVAGNESFDGFWIQNITGGPLTYYVDDVALLAPPPPDLVTVTIDAQSVIRTVDSRTYGMNLAIWDPHLSGTTTTNLLTAMQTGALRFPGGSASDDYDWQTDRSASRGSFRWPNNASTFARITEEHGAQAFVTVNYGSGTPEEAAAWVAYYNASASGTAVIGVDSKGRDWKTTGYWAAMRGAAPLPTDDGYNFLRASHPAPYGFRYWEVGNECYGNWENDLHGANGSGLPGTAHDPYTYAQAFPAFYKKMLSVDPTVRIGAVGMPGEDKYGNKTHGVPNPNESNSLHAGWTPVVLATLKSLGVTPHFLIDHYYAQNAHNESDAVLLQAGGRLRSDAANLRKMIADYVGTISGSSIELVVTELNSVSENPGKQTTSLVNGLFMADALGNLAGTEFNACTWWAFRNGVNPGGNNSASLYGWRTYGDYGVAASGRYAGAPANTAYPSFYAAKLLTHWGRSGAAIVSATSGYALLSSYASKLPDGSLALLVINKHPAVDLRTQFTLDHFTPGVAPAEIYTYGKQNDLGGTDLSTATVVISGSTFDYTFPSYSMTVLVLKSPSQSSR